MTTLSEIKCWPKIAAPADYFMSRLGGYTSESKLASLRGEKVLKPVIHVGAGTCGLGAGADKTLAVLNGHLAANRISADVVEVGCIGLCSEEPIIDIQLPGKARIYLRQVTADRVAELVDNVLAGHLPQKSFVLGQMEGEGLEN